MKFKDFILQMLTGKNTISSKRVMGVLGWFVCLFICVWCTIFAIPAPEIINMLFICSASLLGIDSIMSPFNKKE
jgi:hypothetical protein